MIPNDVIIQCIFPKINAIVYTDLYFTSLSKKDHNFIKNYIIPSFIYVENKFTKIIMLDNIIEYVINNYNLQEIIDYFIKIDLSNNLSICSIPKLWNVIITNKYIDLLYGFAGTIENCWIQIFYSIIDLHEYTLLEYLLKNDVHIPLFQHLLYAITIQETNIINIILSRLEQKSVNFYDRMKTDVHYYISNIEFHEDEIFDTENIIEYDYLLHLSYLLSRNDRYAKRIRYQFRRLQKIVNITNVNKIIKYYQNYFDET